MEKSQKNVLRIYVLFILSGASALTYQVIWARWLGNVFGNTATSVSIVLGCFMLGLAVGSWVVGRLLPRIESPLRVYAYHEAGIGVFALLFPLLTWGTDQIYIAIVDVNTHVIVNLVIKSLLSAVLLLIPTTLMGATLPLLAEFFERMPQRSKNWRVGLLYASNTLGAGIGTLVVSFVLIELVGVTYTMVIAALLNFLVASAGVRLGKEIPLEPRSVTTSKKHDVSYLGRLAFIVLFISGGAAMASEVLWTRALEIIIGRSAYAFAIILIVYLFGITIGSWIMSLLIKRLKLHFFWLIGLLLFMGGWSLLAVELFDWIRSFSMVYINQMVTVNMILLSYLKAIGILFPLAICSGAVFPLATRIIDPVFTDANGQIIARAYSWNTIGAILGSFMAGFLIAPWFGFFQAIYLISVLYLTITIVMLFLVASVKEYQKAKSILLPLGIITVLFGSLCLMKLFEGDRFINRIKAKTTSLEVVFHETGLQGVTTVLKENKEDYANCLLVNGTGMTVKVTETKMMAHLPMLLHPDPQDTLVICFGMGTTYRSAILYNNNVTAVELVGEVFDAFDCFFADAEMVRAYPKGKWVINDGRSYLKLSTEKYDVITLDPPPPIDSAGVNNLYSKEFLELAKSKLKEDGIMAHWIPFPAAKAGVSDWFTFNMLLETFRSVFPDSVFMHGFNGVGIHVFGSMVPIEFADQRLTTMLSDSSIANDLSEWDDVPKSYFQQLAPISSQHEGMLHVTDDNPILEFDFVRTLRMNSKKLHPYQSY